MATIQALGAAAIEDARYYEALLARDPRFDGSFFIGVRTTGVYCRPICPGRPRPENVEYFGHPAAAEAAGYRPCLRCRLEEAPLAACGFGSFGLVRRALEIRESEDPFKTDADTIE